MRFDGAYSDHIQPEALDAISISIFLQDMTTAPGGVGANIAYSMALLGDSPILLASVGHDGAEYMQRLAGVGVVTDHLHHSALPTASFNVITDARGNQVGGFFPGAMSDARNLSFAKWRGSDAIAVVSPHDPAAMRRQVAEAGEHGLRLVYDVGQQVSNLGPDDLAAGLDAAEVLIVNEYELAALSAKTGQSAESIKSRVPVVITTLGANGSELAGAQFERPLVIDVVPPKAEVDPTGAGDAYRAGLLFGLRRGWELAKCARLGATVAAYVVETAGTQNHSFTYDEVAERYAKAWGEDL